LAGRGKAEYPVVSVIVLNYDGAHHLPACLRSLNDQDWPNLEIIVADNASRDNSREIVESFGARFHQMDRNYGFCIANNSAARTAKGDFLFFVNNDMRFERDCISRMMRVVLASHTIFCADPKELDWEGTRIIHHGLRFKEGSFFHWGFLPWVDYSGLDAPIEVPFGCAGAMLVRASMFEELRGFDETFVFDFEEVDVCWRAWLRGWETIYVPGAHVFHKLGGTLSTIAENQNTVEKGGVHTFRMLRRISGQKNFFRFVLKTMPPRILAQVFSREVLRIIGHALVGDRTVARIRFHVFVSTLAHLPSILSARKEALSKTVTSSEMLIRRFMVPPEMLLSPAFGPETAER
jgi:GT2 family glycosyltransferase